MGRVPTVEAPLERSYSTLVSDSVGWIKYQARGKNTHIRLDKKTDIELHGNTQSAVETGER